MRKIVLFFLFLPITLYSQEVESDSFDNLFSDPEDDVVVVEDTVEEIINIVEEKELITFSGSFSGTAGLGVGMRKVEKGLEENNVNFLIGATATSTFNFNIQPSNTARIVGGIEASIDENTLNAPWNDLHLSQLFLEYNLLDRAYISFGKMNTTVASDFISLDSGTTFLIQYPTILSGLNVFAQADENTIDDGKFNYKKLHVGTWLDFVAGSTRFTTGFTYKSRDDKQFQDRFGTLLSMQTSFLGVNAYSDVHYFAYPEHFMYGDIGLYYLNENIFVGTEYTVEGYITKYNYLRQELGLNFRWQSMFSSKFDMYIASKLQFDTLSGFVIPAIAVSPFSYVTVSLAVPYIFGEDGFAVYNDFLEDDYTITLDTELSALLSISVTIPF